MPRRKVLYSVTVFVIFTFTFSLLPVYAGLASLPGADAAVYLNSAMDRLQKSFYVYNDFFAPENHFLYRAKLFGPGSMKRIQEMDEGYSINPQSGADCIRCSFKPAKANDWGGWFFMNGVLPEGKTAPEENRGDIRNAGVNLTGASSLSFYARGRRGGECVEFFCAGVGWGDGTGKTIAKYPDSSDKIRTGHIRLEKQWKKYVINLKGRDLKYVLGGFGWVADAADNSLKEVEFYLDNISYDLPRLNEARFIPSYETLNSTDGFDKTQKGVAYVYDNSVALLAFLASGTQDGKRRAGLIADALVYAQQKDRFYNDGRIRNAYQAGDLALPPGWYTAGGAGTVRVGGWYDKDTGKWYEDKSQVSTSTGNAAWAMLALLGYYQTSGGEKYLKSAIELGEFIDANCRDRGENGGYTAGLEGWENSQTRLTYKSTEHNIDLYAAFKRIYIVTRDEKWLDRANSALSFIKSMWDAGERKFWTGTQMDGRTVNKEVIPLDIQAWALLSLKEAGTGYRESMDYAEDRNGIGGGFDFNSDRDGIWYEGTAQMAAAYKYLGRSEDYRKTLATLKKAQLKSGGMPACDKPSITTGFYLENGSQLKYYHRTHAGATAWLLLAEKGANPFWLGNKLEDPEVTPQPSPAPATDGLVEGEGMPVVSFVSVPNYGSYDNLFGKAIHIKPSDYIIAVYIYVSGWWTKPYLDEPTRPIGTDGSWSCDVTTGGIDQTATRIAAFMIPKTYTPPLLSGAHEFPAELLGKAVAKCETERMADKN